MLSFKIAEKEDGVVNVTENTNVSIVCQAEGRPLPTISLFRKGNDNLNQSIFVANNKSDLKYTINVVNCEEAYNYFCKSENSISVDQRNIFLIVLCKYPCFLNIFQELIFLAKCNSITLLLFISVVTTLIIIDLFVFCILFWISETFYLYSLICLFIVVLIVFNVMHLFK